MANSLMELYGGGMLGPSNNYQLGGRIASSKRGREYQVELAGLERKAKRDEEKRGLYGKVGSVGKFFGNLIAPGFGDVVGTAIESGYKPRDYSGGKYAQDIREDLTQYSKDYKSGILERGIVGGLQSMIMPEVYSGIKEEFGKGLDYLKGLKGPGESAIEAGTGLYGTMPAPLGIETGFEGNILSQPVSKFGTGEKGLGLLGLESSMPIPPSNLSGTFSALGAGQSLGGVAQTAAEGLGAYTGSAAENLAMARKLGLDLSGGQTVRSLYEGAGYGPWSGAAKQYGSIFGRGGGLINYMVPQMQGGGRLGTEYDPTRPQQQQQQQTNPYGQQVFGSNNPVFGPGTDWSGLPISGVQGGGAGGFGGAGGAGGGGGAGGAQTPYGRGINTAYGTATDTMGALKQMGMENIASDPRLQEYLKDLPQFGMGYAQQVGDIYTGGKQAAGSIRGGARTAVGQRGFGRSGIGSQQLESAVTGLTTDIDRQRRGVVEGYQADVLGAIGDIEQKAGFTFGQGTGGQTQDEVKMDDLMSQGYSEADARRMIYEDAQAGPSFG